MINHLSTRIAQTFIEGPIGKIEAIYSKPEQNKNNHVAIICHPHPLHQGTMDNKVVTTLAKTFDKLGMATIRFNFRGVGASEGKYDSAIGECDDLYAVYTWAKENLGQKFVLAGFSFGSYICCRTAEKISPEALVTVAPAVIKQDYAMYPNYKCPWWLIQGDDDEITPAEDVYKWAKTHHMQPSIIKIAGASHFFHGKLGELENKLTEAIKDSSIINPLD